MKSPMRLGLTALAAVASPATALAHVGVGDTNGFVYGFAHPIGGIDHVLAMVAVGMLAALLGGRALWLVPAAFVGMMAIGGALGIAGIGLPLVETAIAASVVVLGLAVALHWNLPTIAAMGLVGFFAVFHGHAHGAEMPIDASGVQYALGFMLATALLHVIGIGIGLGAGYIGLRSRLALRAGGGALALAGIGILAGYL